MDNENSLASSPDTSVKKLAALSHDASSYMRRHVTENPHPRSRAVLDLINDSDSKVHYGAIGNPHLRHEALDLYRLLSNHQVLTHVLNHLAQDENPYVAFHANTALHRLLDSVALEHLAKQGEKNSNGK